MDNLYGIEACMESVKFEVEFLHVNPFEGLGRAIIRGEQDVLFNKRMIDAWKMYIAENGIKWDDK